jgi:hypothetical protein
MITMLALYNVIALYFPIISKTVKSVVEYHFAKREFSSISLLGAKILTQTRCVSPHMTNTVYETVAMMNTQYEFYYQFCI